MQTEQQIRLLEERLRLGDASPEADTSAVFDELLADDVLFVQGTGNSIGKAGVLRGHRPPHKRTFASVNNQEMEIRDLGSCVAVSCRTDFTVGNRAFALRALRVWRRAGDSWKVAVVALMEVPKDDR